MTEEQYETRVRQLESEGLTTSDAQSVADVERMTANGSSVLFPADRAAWKKANGKKP